MTIVGSYSLQTPPDKINKNSQLLTVLEEFYYQEQPVLKLNHAPGGLKPGTARLSAWVWICS